MQMNRLLLSVSALLWLLIPATAQRKPNFIGRTNTPQITKRTEPVFSRTRSSVGGTNSLVVTPARPGSVDSIRRGSSQTVSLPAATVVSASAAVRTSPEVLIQPQHIIRSYYLDLAYNKTVSVVFPAAVRSVDLGSRSIMADKAADVENVLKVKAAQIGFNETNFTVMTADGKFYSFVVNYNETPTVLALNLAGPVAGSETGSGPGLSKPTSLANRTQFMNGSNEREGSIQFAGRSAVAVRAIQSDIVYTCDQILRHRGRGKAGASANQMAARLRGTFVQENVIYYRLVLDNKSNLNYDIDYVRYFVVDSKTAKLTSRQEIELQPIYVYNEAITTVRGHNRIERVYAFQRFTIPNNKQVLIVIGERGGGRELSFTIQNQHIMRARLL